MKVLLPHSAPSWILSLPENLESSSLQDGVTKWYYFLKEQTLPDPNRPPSLVSLSMLCNVPIPIVPLINKICAVFPPSTIDFFCAVSPPPQCSSVPLPIHTDTLPQLKYQSSSTDISECGTPSSACFDHLTWILI